MESVLSLKDAIKSLVRSQVVLSDNAASKDRTHDRNLQTSKSLKLTLVKKQLFAHDSANSKSSYG